MFYFSIILSVTMFPVLWNFFGLHIFYDISSTSLLIMLLLTFLLVIFVLQHASLITSILGSIVCLHKPKSIFSVFLF